jgi:ABC-2 type transport system permease protein
MNKTVIILRHEILATVGRRSYRLTTVGGPLLMIALLTGLARVEGGSGGGRGGSTGGGATLSTAEGYVDQAHLIQAIPHVVLPGHLKPFADEAQAQEALASGQISAYYLIPPDYVARGELLYVYPDSRPLTADGQEWKMVATLFVNLLGGDEALAERVWNPVSLEVFDLGPAASQDHSASNPWARFFPSLMTALLFAAFMLSSSLLSESVAGEKENRTMEVLLLSAGPRQILAGKVIGLGVAGLMQTGVWLGALFVATKVGGQRLGLPTDSPFPPALLAWGLVFFLLGFALYASLMAGAGALVSRLKEVGQVSYLVLSPLMAGYVVGLLAPLADASQRALPIALSLFPLTAPVVMIMRLAAGPVPQWQLLLSMGLIALSAILVLRSVAALFRAQILLSGQPVSLRRLLGVLFGSSLSVGSS